MYKFLILVITIVSMNAQALDVVRYERSSGTGIMKLPDSEVERLWSSNDPVCLKKKNALLGYNKAFKARGLRYGDCSASEAAREDAKLLGYTVHVIKFNQLSANKAAEVAKQLGIK